MLYILHLEEKKNQQNDTISLQNKPQMILLQKFNIALNHLQNV